MTSDDLLVRIERLFVDRGGAAYHGEAVTQLEHALQAATLAEANAEPAALIAAALLHDIGHLLHGDGELRAAQEIDDRHEELGVRFLEPGFGPDVTEPIRLHVAAKRYLTATYRDIDAILSPASRRSLELQGGPMSSVECLEFAGNPHFRAALMLRRYDDAAKAAGLPTPPFSHFRQYLRRYVSKPHDIRLVVFDWAGTTIDFGCLAPVGAFIAACSRRGIEVSLAEARGPMGLNKKDHIRALLAMPSLTVQWQSVHGRTWDEGDVNLLYADVTPLQREAAAAYSTLIPGVLECVAALQCRGIQIAAATGYFRAAAAVVAAAAKRQGYSPDFAICADDVPAGRPAPWMIFRVMEALGVYPPCAVVKVGDTVVDIEDGLNAGVWSVGVVDSSNEMGLSEEAFRMLSPQEQETRRNAVRERFVVAGAHAVINDLAELPALIDQFAIRNMNPPLR